MSLFARTASATAAVIVLSSAFLQPLRAQDTRTVIEPTFPATCTTLTAQQVITSAGEPTSETLFDTSRIQAALTACASGKAVELTTSGTNNAFLIAPLTIPSGVTLLVDAGVTVFGSRNPADYQVSTAGVETCGTVGTAGNGCNPLFNVNSGNTSTGSGVMGYGIINGRGGDKLLINGTASTNSWWDIANQANTGSNSQNNPIMFAIKKASNFTMYKITLMNSPMFHVKWQGATGLTIWGVKIVTPFSARNTDGIDPGDNISNITIANSYISDGDDNVAIGATAGNPASNISITNVHTYSGHGLSIGSYTAGGVSNVAMTGINQSGNLQDTNATGLRIKSGPDRGGVVNNVQYSKVCIENVKYPVQFNPTYSATTGTLPPTFTNIGFHNVSVQTTSTTDSVDLQGYSVNNPLNVTMDNLQFMHSFAAGGDSQGNLNLTPAPKNVNITLGPGPVDPTSLQQISTSGTGVTYSGLVTNPTESRYLCPTTNFPFIAGELFLSTPSLTNQRTLSLGNPASFTLNATIVITEASGPTPTAAVGFYEGTTKVGTASIGGNGTLASVTLNGITSGAHTYTAAYAGDTNYAAVAFGSVTVNVNTIATTTTLTATPTSAIYGNSVSFTVTVAQSTGTVVPGGTVTVTASDGTVVGTGTLNASGVYTFTSTTLPVGTNTLTASYAGSSNFAASDSTASPTVVTITAANTTTTLASSAANATYGATVNLTATVKSATTNTPTGTVTYTDTLNGNTTVLGTMVLTGNAAVFPISTLPTGVHTISASYGGDANFNSSVSGNVQVIIVSASTTTSVGFTQTTVAYGQPVTILATLTPAGGNQTGTVSFYDGSTANPAIGSAAVANASASITISTLAIGQHNIIAVYSGDGNYTGSTSSATPLTVVQAASSTSIAASSTSPTYGTSDTFTATISTTSAGAPTGTVIFKEGTTALSGSVSVNTTGGVTTAVFSTSALSAGAHSIYAVYSGDTNFTGSQSPTVTVTVGQAATTTTLAPPATITYGQSASFSATVTTTVTGTPTGSVTFYDGSTSLGSSTLTGGGATLSASNLSGGTHTITAKYSGDTNFTTSTSAAQTLTVNKASTTTAGSASPTSITYGQSTTITATLSAPAATGTVTFSDGGTAIKTVNVSSGAASFSITTLTTGTHTLSATYNGDTNYIGSTSSNFSVTVTQATSTTTLVASPTNPVFLTSVAFTATLPTGATGTVTFKDGATTLGTGTVSTSGLATTATYSTSALTGGAHSITACYGGDINFTTSCSSAVTVTVSTAPTTTTLAATPSPGAFYSNVTLTATVAPGASTNETGTVTFKDGATTLGTSTLSTTAGITTASLSTSALLGGSHTLTAIYNGDTNFAASTSASVSETINPVATTTSNSVASSTVAYGSPATFTASISPAYSPIETGTVTFKDGTTVLGTGTISSNGNNSFVVSGFSTSTLTVGLHNVTATYNGDTNYGASSSSAISVTITQATTTTSLTASPSPATYGSNVTLSASVVSASATGSVTFKDGNTTLGTAALNNGTATFATTALSTSTHSLTACYSGDTNFSASCSSNTTLVVNPVTPAIALSANPNSFTYGQSTTLTATLTPSTATGTVTFKDQATGQLGTATLSGGVATFVAAGFAGGTHSLQAVYGGDTNDSPASSSTIAIIVNPQPTSTVLTITPTSSTYGASVTFTAKVTPATVTGTVTFGSGNTVFGTATVTGGTATFTSSTIPAGAYSTVAAYSGDANSSGSASPGVLFSVGKATPTATLTSSASTSAFGTPITLTVTLSPTTPTGTVTFSDGSTTIGNGTVSAGIATFTTSSLTGGSHTLSASYGGDNNFVTAATNSLTVVISVAASTTTVTAVPSTVPYNSSSTLSATVSPSAATGTVTFRDGQSLIATVTLTNGSATTPAKLNGGSHSITATYNGDTNVGGSTSAAVTLTVTPLVIPISLTASPSSTAYGATVTFTATLTPPSGTSPTGTVTFMDGNTALISMTVSAAQAQASFSTLLPGTHSITAVYSGDTNFANVTSASQSVTITMGSSTTALTATPPQSTPGAPFTLTANVVATSPVAGENAPTGSIIFSDSTGTLATVPLVNGAASLTRSLTPLGPHNYTATYIGDANYTTSNATVTVTIKQLPSSTTVSATPTSGAYGITTFSFTAQVTPGATTPAITGSVTFNDTSTVPATTLGTVNLTGTSATLSGIALGGGTHNIVAIYSGDVTYAGSDTTAAPAVITVSRANTNTALTANPTTVTTGNQVTLTAVATSTASGTLTGSVSFYEGATLLATKPYTTGGVSYVLGSLTVGGHSYTAVYSGDINYATSTSAAASVTSNAATQTLTITGAPTTLTYGASPFVITATSSSGLPVTLSVTGPTTVLGDTFTVTGAGTITITATQSGNATYAAATPVVVNITVNKAPLTVTTNNFSIAPGQAIPTLTGSISGLVNNDNVTASFSTTATSSSPAGQYPITATLSDSNSRLVNYAVSNPGGTLTIVANAQSITFPAIQTTAIYGAAPITLAAIATSGLPVTYTVTGPGSISGSTLVITGAGSITVTATQPGNNTYSAATPVSQTVTVSTAPLKIVSNNASRAFGAANPTFTGTITGLVNSDNITATYSTTATASSTPGTYPITAQLVDPNSRLANYTVASTPGTLTVTSSTTTMTIASSPSTITFGSSITLTVTVAGNAGGTPTGNITILDGATTLGTVSLTAGSASLPVSTLSVGTHTLSATYAGDANFAAASSTTSATVVVTQASDVTTLTATPTSGNFGTSIALKATVTNATTITATGTVTFRDGTTILNTSTLAGGTVTYNPTTLAGGTHSITACYNGDFNFTATCSSAVTVTINAATTTTAVTGALGSGALGTSATFTGTVTSTASGTPSGTLTFSDGTTTLGTTTLSSGAASFSTSSLGIGSHTITACYSGDANFASSCSATGFAYKVTQATVATTLTVTPTSVAYGGNLVFTAKVASALSTAPTGTITLKSGAIALGTATLSTTGGVTSATITASSTLTGGGAFTAIASYSGDTNFLPSDNSGAPTAFTVTAAPTITTLGLSASQIIAQGSVTFTANVSSAAGTPAGTVQFLNGSVVLATGTLNAAGVATATVANLAVGSYTVTAAYVASFNFAASTSAGAALSVVAPVNMTATPAALTLGPGASGTSAISIAPVLGYTGPVTLTCSSPVAYITCVVTTPGAITGTAATTATATISVAATYGMVNPPRFAPESNKPMLAWLALGGLLLLPFARRRGVRLVPILLLLCGTTAAISGCGSSTSPPAGPSLPPTGTQNVTLTATANGTVVTTTIAVTVTH